MKFTTTNGNKVPYIMVAGADYVAGEMPLEDAQRIYTDGTKRASNRFSGYPVCVDGKYFFAATSDQPKTSGRQKKNV